MNDPRVHRLVASFLENGRFGPDFGGAP
jgi:hypothetical protein